MILSKQSILKIKPVSPFIEEKRIQNGMSYGLSGASYDVRIGQNLCIWANSFELASTLEYFKMPNNVAAQVVDKSSWARKGISCFNTFIDPGWEGYLTLELYNASDNRYEIQKGFPICQIVFCWVDNETDGYNGKYQHQENKPVESIYDDINKYDSYEYEGQCRSPSIPEVHCHHHRLTQYCYECDKDGRREKPELYGKYMI